jgi:hypothetical protein
MADRHLSPEEISILRSQGCEAEDWNGVTVAEPFDPSRIRWVQFSGQVRIGRLDGSLSAPGGERSCGLFASGIASCTLGNHVRISSAGCLSRYTIGGNVLIENVGRLVVEGETSFGNGTEIEVLNEGGGRPLPIFDRLSSQIAYLLVLYRHRKTLVEKLQTLIGAYVKSKVSHQGSIGEGCRVENVALLRDVWLGPWTVVSGALSLEEGTVASCAEDPVFIGPGVTARKFIILSGSKIDESAILDSCFVGQGVRIGKQFSAVHSAFFANSEMFHGEACSLFAGPYTVSHHKSTLLIAGLFSFFNAGSGTNQSNHMYKLGPIHQGILERGSKTGSYAYLRWPCRVGPFSVVIDKHSNNFDASDFPFSYLTAEGGATVLSPGVNLFTVGTRRDGAKWQSRDNRKDPKKLDLIHFELLSPYTVGKITRAIKHLKDLYESTPREREHVIFKGMQIKRLMLRTAVKYYEMAVKIYLGNQLISRLSDLRPEEGLAGIRSRLDAGSSAASSDWVDLSGMLAPSGSIDRLASQVESGEVKDIDHLLSKLEEIHSCRDTEEWAWCSRMIEERSGTAIQDLSADQIRQIIRDWKENSVKLNNMILQDATREFDSASQISYGIDGGSDEQAADFKAVRGTFEGNKFVRGLREDIGKVEHLAECLTTAVDRAAS